MAKQQSIAPMRFLLYLDIVLLIFALEPLLARRPPGLYLYKAERVEEAQALNVTSPPVLVGLRDSTGTYFANKRKHQNFALYYLCHVFPSLAWCILMPLQHTKSIRKNYISFHKISGKIIVGLGTMLAITGLLFPSQNLSFTADHWTFVHKLRVGPPSSKVTVMVWPSFTVGTFSIAWVILFSGFKLAREALSHRIDSHRRWVCVYTYAGYTIPLQRAWSVVYLLAGLLVDAFPQGLKTWLSVPTEASEIYAAELAANAWATAMAWLTFLTIVFVKLRSLEAAKAVKNKSQ